QALQYIPTHVARMARASRSHFRAIPRVENPCVRGSRRQSWRRPASRTKTEPHVIHTRPLSRCVWINVYREKRMLAGAEFESREDQTSAFTYSLTYGECL